MACSDFYKDFNTSLNATPEEMIKFWEKIGFLDGIEDDSLKEKCAIKFNELSECFINTYDCEEDIFETYGYPVIRKIITCGTDEQRERLMNMKPSDLIVHFHQFFYKKEAEALNEYCQTF